MRFGPLITFWQRPLQVHQAVGVHARHGRLAVDQRREYGQGVAFAVHVQQDARVLLYDIRKAVGAYLHRQAFFKRGQHVAKEFGELIAVEMAPLGKIRMLTSRETRVGLRPQDVAAAHDPIAKPLIDGGRVFQR